MRAKQPARTVRGKPEVPSLARAANEFAAGRVVLAIDELLAAWRTTRTPELADLIDRASRLLPDHDKPLILDPEDADAAWDEAFASDPRARLPQLLQNLHIGEDAWSHEGPAKHRMDKLAKLPDDPRIALRLAELACWRRIDPERRSYWNRLFRLLARIRDARTREPLGMHILDQIDDYAPSHYRTADHIIGDFARAADRPPALSPDDRAQVTAIEAQLAVAEAAARVEWDLVAVITDDWDDDAPRMIYADWLIERGHPRGEYILLDCKRQRSQLTDAEAGRFAELASIPYLFGTLDELAANTGRRRDRGLDRDLMVYRCAGTLGWRAAAKDPLLAMVETIRFDPQVVHLPTREDFARVLLAAVSLEAASGIPRDLAISVEPLVRDHFRRKHDKLVRI
jgi:uncharacterized protein (TIGR02996 family)